MEDKDHGSKALGTNGLFASYRIGDFPRAGLRFHPWEVTGTQGIVVNAFDLLANRRTREAAGEIRKGARKLREAVEFSGPLMLDSGAFNFLRHSEIGICPMDVLGIGVGVGADVCVVLDHPFSPGCAEEEVMRRWSNTLRATREMFEALQKWDPGGLPEGFQLMPVLHGHSEEAIGRALEDVLEIWGREPAIIGIGSLAPLARNGSKRIVTDVIIAARRLLPSAHIHCFSLGSALLMLFAFYCGANSVDSQTWIMSAAFKQVQLPGFHLTRLSAVEAERDRGKYREVQNSLAARLQRLVEEEGFVARDWDTGSVWEICNEGEALSYLESLEDSGDTNHIHRRACHNLYAFNFEAGRIGEEERLGRLESFIETRVSGTVYRKAFEYAILERRRS